MRAASRLFLAFLLTTITAVAQSPSIQQIPRDTKQTVTGTARLSGRVVAADTNKALVRAVVQLVTAGPTSRAGCGPTPMAAGNSRGWRQVGTPCWFRKPATSLFVTVSCVRSNRGSRSCRRRPGTGQARRRTTEKGGAIAGRISDEHGGPMAGAVVAAMRYRYVDGQRRVAPVTEGLTSFLTGAAAITDDLASIGCTVFLPAITTSPLASARRRSRRARPTMGSGTPELLSWDALVGASRAGDASRGAGRAEYQLHGCPNSVLHRVGHRRELVRPARSGAQRLAERRGPDRSSWRTRPPGQDIRRHESGARRLRAPRLDRRFGSAGNGVATGDRVGTGRDGSGGRPRSRRHGQGSGDLRRQPGIATASRDGCILGNVLRCRGLDEDRAAAIRWDVRSRELWGRQLFGSSSIGDAEARPD